MADLVELIKKASLDAVETSKPCAVMFGTIMSVSPLKINIEQKLQLEAQQLILTRTAKSMIESEGSIGVQVVLLRMQGGQQFIIIDRTE